MNWLLFCLFLLDGTLDARVDRLATDIAQSKRDLTEIREKLARTEQSLNELPKAYVPRSEHDLRDSSLNVSGRLSKLEERVDQNRRELDSDMKEFSRYMISALLAAVGGVFAGRQWGKNSNGNSSHKISVNPPQT